MVFDELLYAHLCVFCYADKIDAGTLTVEGEVMLSLCRQAGAEHAVSLHADDLQRDH